MTDIKLDDKSMDKIILTAIQIATGLNYGSKQSERYLIQTKARCFREQSNEPTIQIS